MAKKQIEKKERSRVVKIKKKAAKKSVSSHTGGKKTASSRATGKKASSLRTPTKKVASRRVVGKKVASSRDTGKKAASSRTSTKKVVPRRIVGKKAAASRAAVKSFEQPVISFITETACQTGVWIPLVSVGDNVEIADTLGTVVFSGISCGVSASKKGVISRVRKKSQVNEGVDVCSIERSITDDTNLNSPA